MAWVPELFSAPALQRLLDQRRRDELVAVPYSDGFLAGEPDALVESFASEPLPYDPVLQMLSELQRLGTIAAVANRAAPDRARGLDAARGAGSAR
jgi:hypothetical protein